MILSVVAAMTAAAVGLGAFRFTSAIRAARERVASGSRTVMTPSGAIEYGTRGEGEPALVIHGAGGGFDQGLVMGGILLGDHYTLIAPSRFGYLGSPAPFDASLAAQAGAFTALLDALHVRRVAVVAISAGGLSGLEFAVRYPERTRALVMVSAVSRTEPRRINRIVSSNLGYWLAAGLMPTKVLEMMGVPREVQKNVSAEDRKIARSFLETMNPMGHRYPGILLDQTQDFSRERVLGVTAPTLVIHARDDGLVPFPYGEYSERSIPGARFLPVDTGGHFLLGQYSRVRAAVAEFLSGVP